MTTFPRWKLVVVIVALLLGLLFSVPNLFRNDPALQFARRGYEPVTAADRSSIEALLETNKVAPVDGFLQDGRLTLRFDSIADRFKARDLLDEGEMAQRYVVALTTATRAPSWFRSVGLKPMNLGLDLRGGLYLLYQVDVEGAVQQLMERLEQEFRRTLRDERISYINVEALRVAAGGGQNRGVAEVRILLRDPATLEAARAALAKANQDITFTVNDSSTEPSITARLSPTQIQQRQDYAIQQNITTLRNRVNELGVSEPIVQRQGIDRINVQLPGVQNSAQVKDILGKTATLEFRLVDTANNAFEAQQRGRAPLGTKLYKNREGGPVLLKRDIIVTGDQLTDATSSIGQEGPQVNVKLDARGAAEMLKTTQQNLNRPMAVVFIEKVRRQIERDGQQVDVDVTEEQVISEAIIRGVFSSNFQITGLNPNEAANLALLLRAGSLAAPLYPIEERAIGPTLGAENITKGIDALLFGSLLLFLGMAIYYKVFGLIADVVLTLNVILLVALLTMLQAVLTLPGIAGIVLTVAMAVDANILIYERIREEVRNGNSPLASIETGFDKAFSAIADSNVTILIASIVLFVFGTGPIQGFAVTLFLGVLTTLFTAILCSRAIIHLVYGRRRRVDHLSI